MPVKIEIPKILDPLTLGNKHICTKHGKISDVLKDIEEKYPLLARKIIDKDHELRAGILFFKDEKNKKRFLMKNEEILDGQKIVLIVSTAGG